MKKVKVENKKIMVDWFKYNCTVETTFFNR